jgi:DNA gyrase subunit B
MNAQTLWDTTLNPKSRTLLRVTIDDAQECAAMFESLMGKETSERYRLIQENAHRIEADI